MAMKIGKLSNDELKKYILDNINLSRKEVINGAGIGADTAVMDFEGNLVVASTDPITATGKNIGSLAINIACNDIACQGAEPIGVLISALIPPSADLEDLKVIIQDAQVQCKKLNVDIVGGHTEVTDVVKQIVLTTTALGKLNKDLKMDCSKINSSDIIAISKDIAIEGTSILYTEKRKELEDLLSLREKEELESYIDLLSVLPESKIAMKHGVKFMHDVTEGGIYGALVETAKFIGKNIEVEKDLIPIKTSSKKIVDYFKIDPYRLISSGSMIFILAEENFKKFKRECCDNKIKITKIGHIKDGENLTIISDKVETLKEVNRDELYKAL
ncbi:AIR synthase family protein [Peptoniphilus catoniae]|uniref:AIR synthase family protein n=1 Tax=Peptoniphilus catoniae TaxID=1660341 RepID=UPI001FEC474A|nr:AIR synthase family protein [Peptoniphilus catoniae]